MDIIDIILAKKLTPQEQVETYAAKAEKAKQDAADAVATVEAAASNIEETQSAAAALLENAQAALETAQAAQINMPKVYTTTGQNTDGYMTQKAVTDALDTKATIIYVDNSLSSKVDNSTLNNYATTTYVNQQIAAIPSSGSMPSGVSNLGIDNAGKIVIIGADGNIVSGDVTEEAIIDMLIQSGAYADKNALGLIIDYNNKNYERAGSAINKVAGTDFNSYPMYGGRMRCNVADNGTINAFYGDNNYKDDGSNGQVMIYQPKFYYQRIIIESYNDEQGTVINKEQILISATSKLGFKLHPLFINNNIELDYVLLPAYEGNIYDTSESSYILDNSANIDINTDKLSSIANTRPLSGLNKNLTVNNLKQLATNRGEGWQLTDIYSESALQMLAMIEFGSMNGQANIGKGPVNTSTLGELFTGSTSSLGNSSGRASSTTFTTGTYSDDGKTAISYRGMENPWGNLWRFVDKITVKGNGNSQGGTPYINNSISAEFNLPNMTYGWISNLGIGNSTYDWLYMPIKCGNTANSALPVGDTIWTISALNETNKVMIGGHDSSDEGAGFFDYECDTSLNDKINKTNARIMFIPTKNEIYTANIAKWQQHYGG